MRDNDVKKTQAKDAHRKTGIPRQGSRRKASCRL